MTFEFTLAAGIIGVVWLVGFCMSIGESTITDTKYHPPDTDSFWDTGWTTTTRRDAATRDMWYAIWWPLRFVWTIFWIFVYCMNSIVQYPLLLVFIKYKKTKMFKNIDDFCDKRI
jgi:hypothetical protein